MRVVFDCNVLISALLNNTSTSGQALLKAKQSDVILLSTPVLAELINVAMRPKFDKYASIEVRLEFTKEYESLATLLPVTHKVKVCRDPKDDMYLELALSGKADCIVTGDPDLQVLSPFKNIPIISPREFLEKG
ncbi:MAG: putative toxin-antitoxin system toxin component, PIN family [Imperialibacter sp.]|uniref:putative toxin-antitoxin system toxin component, PIN family n=1 Tax=Imperialibacter sp. TaxID=2038411 RepID=UPI0032ECD686